MLARTFILTTLSFSAELSRFEHPSLSFFGWNCARYCRRCWPSSADRVSFEKASDLVVLVFSSRNSVVCRLVANGVWNLAKASV